MDNSNNKTVVEVGGIKMEIDLRHAKKIEHYAIGDKVKVLTKDYSSTYTSHMGIIVGFDNFQNTPAIIIAYVNGTYTADIQFVSYTGKEKDNSELEICPCDELSFGFTKSSMLENFDKDIVRKEEELDELKRKKHYFITNFQKHFEADK